VSDNEVLGRIDQWRRCGGEGKEALGNRTISHLGNTLWKSHKYIKYFKYNKIEYI